MPETNCHIPIKVKIHGKPSENDLVALENKVGDLCVSAVLRSLKTASSSLSSSSPPPGPFREQSQDIPNPTE